MGWFDEQIEYRKKHERELLSDSFENIARAVTGRKTRSVFREDADVSDAVSALLKYMGIREKEVPANIRGLRDRLDYLLGDTGVMYREVTLPGGWHKDAAGAMIGTLREDGAVVALLPSEMGWYEYTDPKTGRRTRIGAGEEGKIGEDALCFYRPLPMRKLKTRDLFRYMMECLTTRDLAGFALAAAAVTLVGLLMPRLNWLLTGLTTELKSTQLLMAVMSFMLMATVGRLLFEIIQDLLLKKIQFKLNLNVEAAAMMRLLALPPGFFRQYSAGELNQYIGYMNSLCDTMVESLFSTGVTGVFSLVYLTQIFSFAPSLVWPSLIITLLTLATTVISALVQMRISRERMELNARERGLVYALINGIQKIRLSGAENRAFSRWSAVYSRGAEMIYNPPAVIRLNAVIVTGVSLIGTAIMYYTATKTGVTVAEYYAFNSAYGYISTAFASLAGMAVSIASIRPSMELIRPLLDAAPEAEEGQEIVTRLGGGIELSHVTFGYDPDSPPLFEDLNLRIPARQYIAIVGKSGCGKSTLVRLLLGFEKPFRGAIYYDRKDMQKLDKKSLRRQIGTVMQDGRLLGGSIYENISISAPGLPLKEAWAAAEIAGIADDIREMPMGMHTILQEGGGSISGGQRQRLMIARAVAPKPRILIFDEATSALDNITQRKVSEALDKMNCTRIVIAHRLSTIRHCDRIVVLDGGKIAESGTYEELLAQKGLFAELVERQRVSEQE